MVLTIQYICTIYGNLDIKVKDVIAKKMTCSQNIANTILLMVENTYSNVLEVTHREHILWSEFMNLWSIDARFFCDSICISLRLEMDHVSTAFIVL